MLLRMAGELQDPLRRFVRDTLGCGCPDEVLDAIRCERTSSPPVTRWRLDVGGRLLVWIVDEARSTIGETVAACLRAGVEERDRLGFNRFRLVVAGHDPQLERSARAAFDSMRHADDRVHLHVLYPEVLPGLLRD